MATLKITLTKKGLRADQVRKAIEAAVPGAYVEVSTYRPPVSRPERFNDCSYRVTSAKEEAEALRDELQSWYDNLPEAFQDGQKGEELTEAIDNLETFISGCEEAEGVEVSFPGMFS